MTYRLLIWRNVCQKPLQSALSIGVVALAAGFALAVLLLSGSVRQGLQGAAEPFDLIVGAKGSPNQLVLNTVFLQDVPIGNIDYEVVNRLRENPAVLSAIPLGFGDTYQNWRIVGAEPELFRHSPKAGSESWLRFQEGRAFEKPFEAVVGAATAAQSDLKIGDCFSSSHGVVAAAARSSHAETFTVVGILEAVGGPYDGAVLVSLDDLWRMHDGARGGVTAVLVKPRGYAEALTLYQKFRKEKDAQMIFPSQAIAELLSLLGNAEAVLRVIGGAVAAMALLVTALSFYWSSLQRARDRAVLRALGATRRDTTWLIFGEGVFLVLSGTILGAFFGIGIFWTIANVLEKKMLLGVPLSFGCIETVVLAAIAAAGVAASVMPAFFAARREIAEDL